MQNLVRVGVADAAEGVRIRQRSLESVILGKQALAKLLIGRLENLQSAGIVLQELAAAAKHVQRSSALGSSFGERERTGVENEVGERGSAGLARPGRKPVQP